VILSYFDLFKRRYGSLRSLNRLLHISPHFNEAHARNSYAYLVLDLIRVTLTSPICGFEARLTWRAGLAHAS